MRGRKQELGLQWFWLYILIIAGGLWMMVFIPLWTIFGPKGTP